jgi:hypothetical protein
MIRPKFQRDIAVRRRKGIKKYPEVPQAFLLIFSAQGDQGGLKGRGVSGQQIGRTIGTVHDPGIGRIAVRQGLGKNNFLPGHKGQGHGFPVIRNIDGPDCPFLQKTDDRLFDQLLPPVFPDLIGLKNHRHPVAAVSVGGQDDPQKEPGREASTFFVHDMEK